MSKIIIINNKKRKKCKKKKRGNLLFTVYYPNNNLYLKGIKYMVLTDIQKVAVSIQPVDRRGHPAQVDDVPVWSSSDETLLSVVAAPDGMSASVLAVGQLGHAQISVTADADLGDGVESIVGILEVDVVASKATGLTITAGTPVDQ